MNGPDAGPDGITFTIHDRDELDLIELLWEGLSAHHRERARANAPAFLNEMEATSFAARRNDLLAKNRNRALRLELAVDSFSARPIGYCVASGAPGEIGEVESIYVDGAFRNRGIGSTLLEHASSWMEMVGTVEQALFVFAGNDRALPFYARHGYSARYIVLVRRSPD